MSDPVSNVFQPELNIRTEANNDDVRCKLCDGPYTGAKVLPCGHSMCRACMEQHACTSVMVCPYCGSRIEVPKRGGINVFRDDVIITMGFGDKETSTFPMSSADTERSDSVQATTRDDAALPKLENFNTKDIHILNDVNFEFKGLRNPLSVAVDINDDIYIAEFGAKQITIFNINAQVKGRIKGEGQTEFTPTGVAINSRRQVMITDILGFRVLTFGRTGIFIQQFGDRGSTPGKFMYPKAVDCHGGLVYICDTMKIQVFRENGKYLRCLGENVLSKPNSVAFSKTSIVVCDADNGVFVFDYLGEVLVTIGEKGHELGQLRSPFGVTLDPDGFILVANGFNHRVDVFDSKGVFKSSFTRQFFIVRSLAFLTHRRLVVLHGDQFQIFTTSSFLDAEDVTVRKKKKSGCTLL